jgi:hypothetical protein
MLKPREIIPRFLRDKSVLVYLGLLLFFCNTWLSSSAHQGFDF